MDVELLLLLLTPVFLVFVAGEWLKYRKDGRLSRYALPDSLCNAALGLMHQGADKLAWLLVLPLYDLVQQRYALFHPGTGPLAWLALFLLQDFCYYWFHRASHRIRWFWAAHSVHHSSTRMNFTTAFRQSIMYPVAGMWAFWLPLALIGFAPHMVVTVVLVNLAFQFFIHTQLTPHLPRVERIFNTPSAHRAHHARNPRYIDRNYAGVLTVWDHLFGTYVPETASEPCDFGTVKPVDTFNPLRVSFTEWIDMLREIRAAASWRDRLALIVAPPEAAARIAAGTTKTS